MDSGVGKLEKTKKAQGKAVKFQKEFYSLLANMEVLC